MNLLPLNLLGPHELPAHHVRFGYLLPWVSANDGNKLFVKVIHEDDQFLQNIPPLRFQLAHATHPDYGDLWTGEITIQESDRPTPASSWGKKGRYVYLRSCTRLDRRPFCQREWRRSSVSLYVGIPGSR